MSATDPRERLAGIRALADGATEGPWRARRSAYGVGIDVGDDGEQLFVETYGLTYTPNPTDAAFIAASRTAVPALVAAVEAVLGLDADAVARLIDPDADTYLPGETIDRENWPDAWRVVDAIRAAITAALTGKADR